MAWVAAESPKPLVLGSPSPLGHFDSAGSAKDRLRHQPLSLSPLWGCPHSHTPPLGGQRLSLACLLPGCSMALLPHASEHSCCLPLLWGQKGPSLVPRHHVSVLVHLPAEELPRGPCATAERLCVGRARRLPGVRVPFPLGLAVSPWCRALRSQAESPAGELPPVLQSFCLTGRAPHGFGGWGWG